MGRRRRRPRQYRPLDMQRLASMPRSVDTHGGDSYSVQHISGSAKTYTCPGCNHTIAPHTGHVVAWATQTAYWNDTGPDARRHWHTACWERYRRL